MPKIVIIGAGFSGICMAWNLLQRNIDDFVIIEKNDRVGGTWWENKYPGAECDVESHLYSFSFHSNYNWSRKYSGSVEIQKYLENCAEVFGLRSHIRFHETVVRCYRKDGKWVVDTSKTSYYCDFLIPSSSPLHCPILPNVEGLQEFSNKLMHTAQWDSTFDISGKRIAVIGNAASGVQCIPEIAAKSKKLFIFQRTPSWIIPKFNYTFCGFEKSLFALFPWWQSMYRSYLFYLHEAFFAVFYKNSLGNYITKLYSQLYLYVTVARKDIREKLTPSYPVGCKRILLSDNYFQCHNRPNVQLITDRIECIDGDAVCTSSGQRFEVDAIVCATGFHVVEPILKMNIEGMQEHRAFLGMYCKGLRNFFLLLGPNTGTGHTGILLFLESQAQHIAELIVRMDRAGRRSVRVKDEVYDAYNREVEGRWKHFVWDQCNSWYLQGGMNATLYPGCYLDYDRRVKAISDSSDLAFDDAE